MSFGTEDLFVVGIGFDIAGAYLLSRGLIAGPAELGLRTAELYGGNPAAVVNEIDDKIRGIIGMTSLIVGFSVQALTYAVDSGDDGSGTFTAAILAAAVPIICVLGVEALCRERLRMREILEVARYDVNARRMRDLPSVKQLVLLGKELGMNRQPDESDEQYALRVFQVEATRE